MLQINDSYKVKGYYNKWSVIDVNDEYALLENETWGDETCCLLVRRDVEIKECEYLNKSTLATMKKPTIMEVIGETFDDLETAIDDYREEVREDEIYRL